MQDFFANFCQTGLGRAGTEVMAAAQDYRRNVKRAEGRLPAWKASMKANSFPRNLAQARSTHPPADDRSDNNPPIEAVEGSPDYQPTPSPIVAGQMCVEKKHRHETS